jgi:hypothetical protein
MRKGRVNIGVEISSSFHWNHGLKDDIGRTP